MTTKASVVVVSDYVPDEVKEASYLRRCLQSLTAQDYEEQFEVILVTPIDFDPSLASELQALLPSLKLVTSAKTTSFQMKNTGARAASGDILAFIDGDCFPKRGWLRAIVEKMRNNPGFAAMTGKTIYEETGITARSFCLLSRALLDAGELRESNRLANHNCAVQRKVALEYPFPEDTTAFGGTVYADTLRRTGHRILFNPEMVAVHIYEGWIGERDIRRNNGYAGIAHRKLYPTLAFGWIVRLGYLSIPILYLGRLLQAWWVCLRQYRNYGITWYQLPYTLALAPIAFSQEIPGMIAALRKRPLPDTAYR
jgi:glycosyltransferase involved in cell wall biosynthesis